MNNEYNHHMKIISFNVNGIRSALGKGLATWLETENPDIICFQETKAQADQIDRILFQSMGYHCLFHSAEKKGYSGVAILSKRQPENYAFGMGNDFFDREGRVIRADFGDITLVCVYIPSGSSGDLRQALKMEFLQIFTDYLEALRKQRPKILICGDFNICHKAIDINHPERHATVSGFLPEEREWFDRFIERGMVDTFRQFNPEPSQYSWWSFRSRAREKNLGWRIDYHIITEALKPQLTGAAILQEVVFSDHCPVVAELKIGQEENNY
jgi:exodeoxyribonuclease-3